MPCKAVRINKATAFYVTVHPLDRLVRKNKRCAHNPMRELLRGKQRGLGQRRTGTETTRAGGAEEPHVGKTQALTHSSFHSNDHRDRQAQYTCLHLSAQKNMRRRQARSYSRATGGKKPDSYFQGI